MNNFGPHDVEDENNENEMVVEDVYSAVKQMSMSHGCMMNFTKKLFINTLNYKND